MAAHRLACISPIDGRVCDERAAMTSADLDRMLTAAVVAQRGWRGVPLAERLATIERAIEALLGDSRAIADELAVQMGRPVRYGAGEVATAAARARHMLALAEDGVAPDVVAPLRAIVHEPAGVVLVIAPWNYPLLTAINAIVPALAAGNAVILKHSAQTPFAADRFAAAFDVAGLPSGVFAALHCTDPVTLAAVRRPEIGHLVFTGSVEVGRMLGAAAAERLVPATLELGGKDAAYVRGDADVAAAAAALAEGAFFNSGQSCCAVERIYVDAAIHDDLVDALAVEARRLRLGDPRHPETTLGPMTRAAGAEAVAGQIADARAGGADALIGRERDGNYLPTEVLIEVDHRMAVMREETFGPVVGVMPVRSDSEAVALIDDSRYGLTASIWTADADAAAAIAERLTVGTVYHNRCDALDPALPWSGRRDSGVGLSLSHLAYRTFTRPKALFGLTPANPPTPIAKGESA